MSVSFRCVSLAIKAVTQANQYKLIKMSKWVKELVGYWNAKDDQDLKQAAGNLKKEQIEGERETHRETDRDRDRDRQEQRQRQRAAGNLKRDQIEGACASWP